LWVLNGIVSGLMGLAMSFRETSVKTEGDQQMSTANPEPRQSGEAEGSARQSSRLDQLKVPLVFTVEEAANRLGVGRTVMYSLVSSGAVESVRIGRLRRDLADALVTFSR
jgi:excisionase family DNA binding protein